MGGGGGGVLVAPSTALTSFISDTTTLLSTAESLCFVSLWHKISVSNFSFVLARLASRSSFSWCFRSNSCSRLARFVARSAFSLSNSSAFVLAWITSSSCASLKKKTNHFFPYCSSSSKKCTYSSTISFTLMLIADISGFSWASF